MSRIEDLPSPDEIEAKYSKRSSIEDLPSPDEIDAKFSKDESLGSKILSGIEKTGRAVDSVTGAPTRAALYAAQNFENPLSAWANQLGDSQSAPTGKMIAERAGIPDEEFSPTTKNLISMVSQASPFATGIRQLLPQHLQDRLSHLTKSEIAGAGIDMAADPLNFFPAATGIGKLVDGGKAIGKAAVSHGASALSGFTVPAEAVTRLIERPSQIMSARNPGRALEIAQNAENELLARNAFEKQKIQNARKNFRNEFGDKPVDTSDLIDQKNQFISNNQLTAEGKGAITPSEVKEAEDLENSLRTSGSILDAKGAPKRNAGDLQKTADWVQNQIDSFNRPQLPVNRSNRYQSYLGSLNHNLKSKLHEIDPNGLAQSDKQFSEYADKSKFFGNLEKPDKMESFVNSFYGPNKTAMQDAATDLIPNSLEEIKDLATDKVFNGVGPSGSNHGLRNLLAASGIGAGAATHNTPMMAASVALGVLGNPKLQRFAIGNASKGLEYLKNSKAMQAIKENANLINNITDPKLRGTVLQLSQLKNNSPSVPGIFKNVASNDEVQDTPQVFSPEFLTKLKKNPKAIDAIQDEGLRSALKKRIDRMPASSEEPMSDEQIVNQFKNQ
jgi:hypothetical protein